MEYEILQSNSELLTNTVRTYCTTKENPSKKKGRKRRKQTGGTTISPDFPTIWKKNDIGLVLFNYFRSLRSKLLWRCGNQVAPKKRKNDLQFGTSMAQEKKTMVILGCCYGHEVLDRVIFFCQVYMPHLII